MFELKKLRWKKGLLQGLFFFVLALSAMLYGDHHFPFEYRYAYLALSGYLVGPPLLVCAFVGELVPSLGGFAGIVLLIPLVFVYDLAAFVTMDNIVGRKKWGMGISMALIHGISEYLVIQQFWTPNG